MGNFRTPIISELRENGSTFYTFSSAMEDIGLNINERNNKVYISNYVLLNLPDIAFEVNQNEIGDGSSQIVINNFFGEASELDEVRVNLKNNLQVENEKVNNTKKWFPNILQNYMMNMETVLRNNGSYDHSASSTVTERCFWKFLQKSGAIKFIKDGNYYHEEWENGKDDIEVLRKKCVIKGFGTVSSSSQSSNAYNINSETYVLIPSSYGQMKYLLEPNSDNNMSINQIYTTTNSTNLEGHSDNDGLNIPMFDNYTKKVSGSLVSDCYYSTSRGYNSNNPEENCLEMVFDTTKLKDQLASNTEMLSIDDLAINESIGDNYDFNTILLYYTIYDSMGNSIATNLFGMLLINDVVKYTDGSQKFNIPSIAKIKSSQGGFGSSYAFRLNLQTASIYDATNDTIIDYSTSEASTLTDFNGVVSNLKNAVDILKNNAVVLTNVYNNNQTMRYLVNNVVDRITEVEKIINEMLSKSASYKELSVGNLDSDSITAQTLETGTLNANESLSTGYITLSKDGVVENTKISATNQIEGRNGIIYKPIPDKFSEQPFNEGYIQFLLDLIADSTVVGTYNNKAGLYTSIISRGSSWGALLGEFPSEGEYARSNCLRISTNELLLLLIKYLKTKGKLQ